jgi:PncC family amidohydrolase
MFWPDVLQHLLFIVFMHTVNNSQMKLEHLAEALVKKATKCKIIITSAESCTGGLLASYITSIPGSSEVFDRGYVTYSYESKTQVLGVKQSTIQKFGAVSSEVALAMVKGACANSNAQLGVGITGIAGPTGATETKPIGLVYIATCFNGELRVTENYFKGDRNQIRKSAAEKGLQMMLEQLN